MDYDNVMDMVIHYLIMYVLTYAIDWFLLTVQDFGQIEDVDGIDGPPWNPDRVMEWTVCGLRFLLLHA
jgi:hypothetical protein